MEILPRIRARRIRPSRTTANLQRQRRLTRSEVDNLVDLYATGINVRQLAAAFGINRDTALRHLQRRDVPSRASIRELTDDVLRLWWDRPGGGLEHSSHEFALSDGIAPKESSA